MYTIEKTTWGFKLTFSGFIEASEMRDWVADSEKELCDQMDENKFYVLIDMRRMIPLPGDSQKYMCEGQKLYREKGMERSMVVLNNAVTTMQFKRIAKESGIQSGERYLDASSALDWEKQSLDWLIKGKDPEL